MPDSLTSLSGGQVHTFKACSSPPWRQATRDNVSYLSQLPMSKTKECHLPAVLAAPSLPIPTCQTLQLYCQGDSDSTEAMGQFSLLSPWSLDLQIMRTVIPIYGKQLSHLKRDLELHK